MKVKSAHLCNVSYTNIEKALKPTNKQFTRSTIEEVLKDEDQGHIKIFGVK